MTQPVPKNSSAIKPGIKIHCIHPDWLMSCKRLAATAIEGINIGINRTNVAPSNAASDTPLYPKRKPATKKYPKQKSEYNCSDHCNFEEKNCDDKFQNYQELIIHMKKHLKV